MSISLNDQNYVNTTETNLDQDMPSMPEITNAAYGLLVDGVSDMEMNVAYSVTDTVVEDNEAYGVAIDGIGIEVMKMNIAYSTGALTTHEIEDSAGYATIR